MPDYAQATVYGSTSSVHDMQQHHDAKDTWRATFDVVLELRRPAASRTRVGPTVVRLYRPVVAKNMHACTYVTFHAMSLVNSTVRLANCLAAFVAQRDF